MFTVYKSNSLDVLLLKAYNVIEKKPLSNIFNKEIILYENKVLFQYLNIFFAQKIGISANFKLYHPNNFIWKLFQIILSDHDLQNTFTHSMMTWKIMTILDNKKFFKNYNIKEDQIQKFKFSYLMAKIFKKYIFYRPHWINQWEREKKILTTDENEKWQIKLWMKMIYNTKKTNQSIYHFSNLFYIVQKLIKEKKIKKKQLPNRCFIISSFALNASYIKFFKKISIYINIYFLYITPCKNNLFNSIQKNQFFSCQKIEKKHALKNSLITLWGQYEKIYNLYIINSKKVKIINCFKKNKNKTLLNNIQNDLFQSYELKKKDF